MTQEEREEFFEDGGGLLKKAVSDEKWDAAFQSKTPLNGGMTLNELKDYCESSHKHVCLQIWPDRISLEMGDAG